MAIRDWRWPQWLILISVITLFILGAVFLYVISRPIVFTPRPIEPEPSVPIDGLPTIPEGAPDVAPSLIESIPLSDIQGLDRREDVDLVARGDITHISTVSYAYSDHVSLAPDGKNINYYDTDTNRFYRVESDGTITKISDKVFADVETVAWAPNSSDAVLEFPDGSNVVYNFDTEDQITLPPHWTDFDFSPDSNKLAFKSLGLDYNERWLAVSDSTGGSTRFIEHLGDNEDILDVDWAPNNQVIGTYTRTDGLDASNVYFVGFNGENFPLSKLHGLNFEGTWTPDGNNLVYSVMHYDTDFKPSLWIADGPGETMGQNRQQIGLQTWSHKCGFASDTVMYCGVPIGLPEGAGLLPSIAEGIPDEIYRVDLTTGVTEKIATPRETISIDRLIVNEDETSIFIHDNQSQVIKKIDLE